MLKSMLTGLAALVLVLFSLAVFVGDGCSCTTREMAYAAAMRSDLRNLVTVQEQAFARDSVYLARGDSASHGAAWGAGAGFAVSTGVVLRQVERTADGWRAEVGHSQMPGTCAVYAGSVPADTAYEWKGPAEPVCSRDLVLRPRRSPMQRLKRMFS